MAANFKFSIKYGGEVFCNKTENSWSIKSEQTDMNALPEARTMKL
jgi:hypothetical protein